MCGMRVRKKSKFQMPYMTLLNFQTFAKLDGLIKMILHISIYYLAKNSESMHTKVYPYSIKCTVRGKTAAVTHLTNYQSI